MFVCFYIDDFQLTYVPPVQIQTNIPSIYQTLSYYFPIGAAVDPASISGPHAQLLAKHFNSIVSGNDMKWSSTEATEGTFTFATADTQVSFAQTNHMLIRGHNLVWASGSQTPSWVFLEADGSTPLSASKIADQALLTQRIQNHIKAEVQHFGSKIYVWDKRLRGCRHAITWNYLECRLPGGMTLGVHDGWHVLRLPFRRLHYCPRIIIGGDSMLGGSRTL